MEAVVAPVLHWYSGAIVVVPSVSFSPGQMVRSAPRSISSTKGTTSTCTSSVVVHPFSESATLYVPPLKTVIEGSVEPLLHSTLAAPGATCSTVLSPSHKVTSGPSAGTVSGIMPIVIVSLMVQAETVTSTQYV